MNPSTFPVGAPVRPRRLLLVTHYFPAHGGGVENVARDLALQMLELDSRLEIHWCAGDCDVPPAPHPRLHVHPLGAWNGVEKRLGIPYPLPTPRALWGLWRQVRRCDAVHLHDFAYASNALSALFCSWARKPFLVTQHIGLVPYANPLARASLALWNRIVGRLVLSRARHVVFCSRRVERYFARFVRRDKRTFLPNGLDAQVFFPANASERARLRGELGVAPGELAVAFVGRFVEKKGVPLLLRLTARFPEVKWLLAGRGPLDPGDDFALGVRVWRDRSGAAIADLFRAADALVLPSQGEGFPLVVQEALACGTPVLVESAIGGADPGARVHLHLEPLGRDDDEERWDRRLHALLDGIRADPHGEAERREERARWASSRWSWRQCALEYLALLDEVLQEEAP